MAKLTKAEAEYTHFPKLPNTPSGIFACGTCRHFFAGRCGAVEGEIRAGDCCSHWEADSKLVRRLGRPVYFGQLTVKQRKACMPLAKKAPASAPASALAGLGRKRFGID